MKKIFKIKSFCSPYLMSADEYTSLTDLIDMMKECQIRHIPITRGGLPVGIVSERDLAAFQNKEFASKFTAGDLMIEEFFSVIESTDLKDVIKEMEKKKIGSCLVENESGELTGIFTVIDALRTLNVLLEQDSLDQKEESVFS